MFLSVNTEVACCLDPDLTWPLHGLWHHSQCGRPALECVSVLLSPAVYSVAVTSRRLAHARVECQMCRFGHQTRRRLVGCCSAAGAHEGGVDCAKDGQRRATS